MVGSAKNFKNTSLSMQIFLLITYYFLTSYVAFNTETIINFIMHKQTLPSSTKHFGTCDAGVLLEDKGLFPFFEPEIKPD